MEPTPSSSPSKRTRAKAKVVVAKEPVESKTAAVKNPKAPRKTPTSKRVETTKVAPIAPVVEVEVLAATLDLAPQDVSTMIATAAYYLAAARNFSPGHELEDWLVAERAIHAQLYG